VRVPGSFSTLDRGRGGGQIPRPRKRKKPASGFPRKGNAAQADPPVLARKKEISTTTRTGLEEEYPGPLEFYAQKKEPVGLSP